VKFKLDENLSPSLTVLFATAGHDAQTAAQQALNGQPDERIIEVCRREQRVLVTLDLDFSNIAAYPPTDFAGLVVLRLTSQAHVVVEGAVKRVLALLSHETLPGALWIVEERRIRIRG